MANLTPDEFSQAIGFLAEDIGLQRLRDRFVRLNALVTRRRASSAEALANQLYMLTGALRRQVPATVAFHSIWAEQVNEKLGEEGEKELEQLAEKVNGCLGERDKLAEGKEAELETALLEYEQRLAGTIGAGRARLDMLLKAVPDVAAKLRAMPPAEPKVAASKEAEAEQAAPAGVAKEPPGED